MTRFTKQEIATVYRTMRERRDMRHFLPDSMVDEAVLQRLLEAAHSAPSVGLMQPWRFIRIRASALRQQISTIVENERLATAQALGERAAEFMRIKVDGIDECAELLAVVLAPDDGTILGRRTMPQEMALCSVACAIQNLWLAARAENLGMGWVSLFDPAQLAGLLGCPPGAKPVALLCLGPVREFYERPGLELANWRQGKPLSAVLMEDGWAGTGEISP